MDFPLIGEEAGNDEGGVFVLFLRKTLDAEKETVDRVEYGTTSHLLAFDKTRRDDGGRLVPIYQ